MDHAFQTSLEKFISEQINIFKDKLIESINIRIDEHLKKTSSEINSLDSKDLSNKSFLNESKKQSQMSLKSIGKSHAQCSFILKNSKNCSFKCIDNHNFCKKHVLINQKLQEKSRTYSKSYFPIYNAITSN